VGPEQIDILGVPVHRVRFEQTVGILEGFIASGEPHLVVTADASAVVIAGEDAEYREIVRHADLVTPDGAGLLWAARRFGTPLVERVSGVDLSARLCALGGERGWRVFLYGAAPGVAEQAAANLRERHPGLEIAGTQHGFLPSEEQPALVERIAAARPHILLVALGIPRQEKFIARYKEALGVPVMMGVGGTLDVFAGVARRAPVWVQRVNLEWLYRLLQNPKKISKVAMLPRFAVRVLRRSQKSGVGSQKGGDWRS
jgi:N-acetylglucosaminyldiphosphoundecaprenol N-acetyl-beta-D-mannosaminyltransferase